jgi:IS30 family transposase
VDQGLKNSFDPLRQNRIQAQMSYKHLTHEERFTIATLHDKKYSQTKIAEIMGRHPSTVGRELKRNSQANRSYDSELATKMTKQRAAQASCRASRIPPESWKYVDEKLTSEQWSPEEITGRMKNEGLQAISHETIYRRLWADKKSGGSLHSHLRHKIGSYRKRDSPRERRGHIPGQRCISTRPPEVEDRTRFGDYELDTVIGLQSGPVLVTIVDRRSRRALLIKAADKTAQAVSTAIISALGPYRKEAHTLTFDNGKEFASHQLIDEILLTTSYFAHPYHSWERGLNENTNGLIRQYFPKRTDFSKITDEQIYEVQEKLNNRPRKCLGWRTPNEVFLKPTAIVALPC